eukprot:scaffold113004_cov32-Tisochrysis_lutea.AAC.5
MLSRRRPPYSQAAGPSSLDCRVGRRDPHQFLLAVRRNWRATRLSAAWRASTKSAATAAPSSRASAAFPCTRDSFEGLDASIRRFFSREPLSSGHSTALESPATSSPPLLVFALTPLSPSAKRDRAAVMAATGTKRSPPVPHGLTWLQAMRSIIEARNTMRDPARNKGMGAP